MWIYSISNIGPRQRLLSAMTSALVGRHTQHATIGDHAFAAAAPAVWNSLSEEVQSSTSLQLFRRRLVSKFFRRSQGPRHSTWLYLAVTWPCSFATLRRVNRNSFIIIIVIMCVDCSLHMRHWQCYVLVFQVRSGLVVVSVTRNSCAVITWQSIFVHTERLTTYLLWQSLELTLKMLIKVNDVRVFLWIV